MPLTPDDLARINTARTAADTARDQLNRNSVDIGAARAEVDRLVRTGVPGAARTSAERRLADLTAARQTLQDKATAETGRLRAAVDAVFTPAAPESLFASLKAETPILLMPARLETRYFNNNTELRVRIYPDQVHIDSHDPALTEDELKAGTWYWDERWKSADAEKSRAAFLELSKRFRPRRAAWIVRAMQPGNLAALGTAAPPTYPTPARRPATWSSPPQAALLPDRWVVIGYALINGVLTEVFRKWTLGVPDRLNAGPDPQSNATPATGPDGVATELPVDGGMKWLIDYDAAVTQGMAVTVRAADVRAGFALTQRIERLVALGVDWTQDGMQSAAALEKHLTTHVFSDGISLLTPGTPTNNSAAQDSGFDSAEAAARVAIDPTAPPPANPPAAAAVADALGIQITAAALDRVEGAGRTDEATNKHLLNLLWHSTLGYTLDQMFDPVISEQDIESIRGHVVAHLRPGGPLPALRIGRQPYGILPVVAPDRYTGEQPSSIDSKIAAFIGKIRDFWVKASGSAPQLGQTSVPMDERLEALLQQKPVGSSIRYRHLYLPNFCSNSNIDPTYGQNQEILRRWLFEAIGIDLTARITGAVADKSSHPLRAAWVQPAIADATSPLSPNYLADIANNLRNERARASLISRENAESLLEVLAAHAAIYELDRVTSAILVKDMLRRGLLQQPPSRIALRTPELVGIEDSVPLAAAAGERAPISITTPAEQARLVLPDVTGRATVVGYVLEQLRNPASPDRAEIAPVVSVLESLTALAATPAADLERAFRSVLDGYGHRLDAWYTSLATRRLRAWRRRSSAKTIYLGGFGWVEKLEPNPRPDSMGYIHAPSLRQAQTAAVLRSGHLANRDPAGDPARSPLAIDLSSRRVRLAARMLEGMAQGQPLTALLGYRFERALRTHRIQLAKYILPMRCLFPLRAPPNETQLTQQEAIAARDVVDGVRLVEQWRLNSAGWLANLQPAPPTEQDLKEINLVAAEIGDIFDAVGDLLVAEGVHQTVSGNLERASAALAGLDRQVRPIEPEVIRTPRSGRSFLQRLLVVLTADAPQPSWNAVAPDVRAKAEPRVNAWIARLIGDPKRIGFGAHVMVPHPGAAPTRRDLTPIGLAKLGWSPLSLLMLTHHAGAGRTTELQEQLAALFATQVTAQEQNANAELHLNPEATTGFEVGLAAFEALIEQIRAVVCVNRALTASDLVAPGLKAPSTIATDELAKRADAVVKAVTDAAANLARSIARAAVTAAELRTSLLQAATAGVLGAVPGVGEDLAALRDHTDRVIHAVQAALAREQALHTGFTADPKTPQATVEHHTQRIKLLLGESFPVVPLFEAEKAAMDELTASLKSQDALLGTEKLAPQSWLDQMARVRPATRALARCLEAAEILAGDATARQLDVAQVPHAPAARWIGLPITPATPAEVQASMVVHVSAGAAGDIPARIGGYASDEWTEVLPSAKETTAITFHYDAPGARAPQAILLAVHPDMSQGAWRFDDLLGAVSEAFELAKLRAVRPQDLDGFGSALPLVYLPDNYTRDVPGVNWNALEIKADAFVRSELKTVLGKG